jgi:signal peptidase II
MTHIIIIIIGFILDQWSKFWAVDALGSATGEPQGRTISVIGDLWRFRLAYNEGAAFSMRPQEIAPFLHPTVFFALFSAAAISALVYFYFKGTEKEDWMSRTGVAFILSGALGNLADRMRIHKVVDFIDWDFPDFIMYRWPTFNLADSWVLTGVGLIFGASFFYKSQAESHSKNSKAKS